MPTATGAPVLQPQTEKDGGLQVAHVHLRVAAFVRTRGERVSGNETVVIYISLYLK
jgi:hypothetical protein